MREPGAPLQPALGVPGPEREQEPCSDRHQQRLGGDAERDRFLGVNARGDENRCARACLPLFTRQAKVSNITKPKTAGIPRLTCLPKRQRNGKPTAMIWSLTLQNSHEIVGAQCSRY